MVRLLTDAMNIKTTIIHGNSSYHKYKKKDFREGKKKIKKKV